jgi:hypothetical protein
MTPLLVYLALGSCAQGVGPIVVDQTDMKYQRLTNLVVLVTAVAYFAATFLGQQMKLRTLCEKLLIISQRFSAFRHSGSTRWPMGSDESSPPEPSVRLQSHPSASNWS